MSVDRICICSINICGLNDRVKRHRVELELGTIQSDIVCVQETHIPWAKRRALSELGYTLLSCTSQSISTRGVAILNRHSTCSAGRVLSDSFGRWLIVECHMGRTKFTLCSVYGSNVDEAQVFDFLNLELASWPAPLILCRDLNIHLEVSHTQMIASSYTGRKLKVYRALWRLVIDYGLIDVWAKYRHPDPGFTFYLFLHNTFYRLDYFFYVFYPCGRGQDKLFSESLFRP